MHNNALFKTDTFVKSMKPIIPAAMNWVVRLLFFYKEGLTIKQHSNIDM